MKPDSSENLTRSCPPCNGNCRQGRDCPAYDERPPLTSRGAWIALGCILAPWLALGVLVLVVRSCAS